VSIGRSWLTRTPMLRVMRTADVARVDVATDQVPPHREQPALVFAVVLYLVVLVVKLGAYVLTGVMALFAEALHSLGDIFVSGFLLVALVWSRKGPDERHMFGYGRAQSAAALVAATLFISFTALRLYEEAIRRLFSSEAASYDNPGVAVLVLVVSMLLAGAPLVSLVRSRRRGPVAKAQMWELVNDELGLIAALAGTALAIAGQVWADPVAAIAIATIISWKAVSLFRENLCVLLGRAPSRDQLLDATAAALAVPGAMGVHDLRAEYVAPDAVHLDMHVDVAPATSIEEADAIASAVETAVHAIIPGAYCVVDVDAANGSSRTPTADVT
jgi:ferrous-iron efflux pump FieF